MDSGETPLADGCPPRTNQAPQLRRLSWLLLGMGLALGTFLIVFWLGAIPRFINNRGTFGTVLLLTGAATTYAAGIFGWFVFSRLVARLGTGSADPGESLSRAPR